MAAVVALVMIMQLSLGVSAQAPGLDEFAPETVDTNTQASDLTRLFVKASAQGRYDGSSWDDAFVSLQDALDAAHPTDGHKYEIWVAAGTYRPTWRFNPDIERSETFQMKNDVAIFGGFSGNEDPDTFDLAKRDFVANETTLSGDLGGGVNALHVFYHPPGLGLGNTAVLDGVTISGGNANYGGFRNHVDGGGMYNDRSSPALQNVTVRGNKADHGGGGIFNYESSPTLIGVTISENTAGLNGGGISTHFGNPTLVDVVVSGNTAGWDGGGLDYHESSPMLKSVTISGNTASRAGGGFHNQVGNPTLVNVIISGNRAGERGGGIYTWRGNTTLEDVVVSGNTAGIYGGGIYDSEGSPTLMGVIISGNRAFQGGGMNNVQSRGLTATNVVISGNTATGDGGGIFNRSSSLTLTNMTISGNKAGNGGGIYNADSILDIRNSIIWGNWASGKEANVTYFFDSSVTIEHSLVGGPNPVVPDGIDPDSVEVIALFVEPINPSAAPTAGGDYRLQAGSLALGAGSYDYYLSGASPDLSQITTDLAGNPRVSSCHMDLGAYEYQWAEPSCTVLEFVNLVVTVPLGTPFAELDLPEKITVRLDEATITARVSWLQSDYQSNRLGRQVIRGELGELPNGVTNPLNLQPTIGITVVDEIAPVITAPDDITVEATGADGAIVIWELPKAHDNVDGDRPVTCDPAPGSLFGLGTTRVTCTAKDLSDNESTVGFNVSVVVAWAGPLSPVSDGSAHKLGSTLPVKFALARASAQISDLEASLWLAPVDNGEAGEYSPAKQTGNGHPGNLFRWADGQYVFNLDTKGLQAGVYRLRIDLGDGIEYTAEITLRK